MKIGAAIGEAPWHGTDFASHVRRPTRKTSVHRRRVSVSNRDLRRIPCVLPSWDSFPGVLFCQNLAFPLPPDQLNIDLCFFPVPSGSIPCRLAPQSSTARPAIFDEAGRCLHVKSVGLNYLIGRFLKRWPVELFEGVVLGDGDAWTGRSPSECLDGPPN